LLDYLEGQSPRGYPFPRGPPGGEEFAPKYAGRDAVRDGEEHEHPESAYDMLDDSLIGRLGARESVVSEDWVATDNFTPSGRHGRGSGLCRELTPRSQGALDEADVGLHVFPYIPRDRLYVLTPPSCAAKRIILNKFTGHDTFPSLRVSFHRHFSFHWHLTKAINC